MKMNIKYTGALLAAAVLLTSGCVERKLSPRPFDGPLKVNLVWPGSVSGEPVDVDGAVLYLYGSDGALYQKVECASEGYEARVPADSYTILAINSDCVNTMSQHEDDAARNSVRALSPEGMEEYLRHVADVFCIGTADVEVASGNVATEVTMYPENTVKYLNFEVDPDYVEAIESLRLVMTGVVPSVKLSDGDDFGEETRKVFADAEPVGGGRYTASMSVFGWRGENVVTAEVHYSDGRDPQISIGVDISDQLDDLPEDGGNVDITIEMPDGGEIDLSISVAPWKHGTGSGIVGGENS